jgi:signal transduction histidine kinase
MIFLQKIVNSLSIRRKLITLGMVTSTIATIITCGSFIVLNIATEQKDLITEMRLVSSIFADEWAEYIYHGNKEQIIKSVGELKSRTSFLQLCLYKENKKEFLQFSREPSRTRSCDKINLTKGKYEFRRDEIGEYLVVSYPIIYKNHRIAYLTMIFNLDRIASRINRGLISSFVLLVFILVISYLISRFLQRRISQPILHLADVSYAVRDGDYNIRASHFANDELGVLTQAYNSMLDEIQYAKNHLEEKVAERTKDLENMMEIKSQFLSNMSHEIRTPIHGIMNYADFLVQDWEELTQEQKYSFVKKLYHNSDRLLSLINNLLDLSKLDAGKMEFYMKKENLAILIAEVIQECEALYIQNKNLQVDFQYNKSDTNIAVCDQEKIRQVIRNLLSNAIKFTDKGNINIELKTTRFKPDATSNYTKALEFSLQDEGVGIPENELEYIFDKFNQSAKTKTGAGGTGLGLAISKEIIKAHNGRIWAENNLNSVGSKFIFIIPVRHNNK